MKNRKVTGYNKFVLTTLGIFAVIGASAQIPKFTHEEWKNPGIYSVGTAPLRTEFISFDARDAAEKGRRTDSPFYMELEPLFGSGNTADVTIDIPFMWLDRDIYLHVAGIGPYYVKVNGRTIGYASDDTTPAEFHISRLLADGGNTITFEKIDIPAEKKLGTPNHADLDIYIYSQPKLRIEDYAVTTRIDTTGTHCILKAEVVLANTYNFTETFRLGYDLYMPDGHTMVYYDLRDVTIPGNSSDTVVFEQRIYNNVMRNLWSAETPKLYHLMFNINYNKRWTEYIPVKVGFGELAFEDNSLIRNGKPIDIKAVGYSKTDRDTAKKNLAALKKSGYNTICPDAPQPIWFYDLCESLGLYVIEQANIYSTYRTDDREVGGAYSNAPAWLGSFLGRAEAMYARVAHRPCIIGWSLGSNVGNGYNMYKTYQWLEGTDKVRPVIFRDAQGEWNTDMDIYVEDGGIILERLAQQPTK